MFLLQNSNTTDWTPFIFPILLEALLFYGLLLVMIFFIIKMAVRAGTKEQRKQLDISNNLLIEQMKNQGISAERINEILQGK